MKLSFLLLFATAALVSAAPYDFRYSLRNAGNTAFNNKILAEPGATAVLQWNDTTNECEWAALAGGGDALVANPLSQFAATTSAQFKGVISDENAPDGASSKVLMALGSLSVASGKTGTFSNTLTLSGTDGSTLNIGAGGTLGTGAYATIADYLPLAGGTMTGHLLFTDATYDIGASGATRPRHLFLSGNATIGGDLGVTGTATTGNVDTATFAIGGVTITSSAAELNALDGIPAGLTATEIGYSDGLTSGTQGQLDAKLALAGGTMTGNVTLGENASIALDPAGSADGKYTGITIAGTAGATLAFGDLIYLDPTDSRWELVDANAAAAADGDARGLIGICVLAAAADASATVILLQGTVRADAAFPALTVGAAVYASETAGDIVVTSPTTSGNVVRVCGYALTADEMVFNPSGSWITYTP